MASLRTPTSNDGGQGTLKVISVSACVTGDTVYYSGPVRSWIPVNRTTTDAITVTYTDATKLFTITVANTPDIDILVVS
jgi:hypothetical protein